MTARHSGGTPDRSELENALAIKIDDKLLERALTHRSYAYENGGLPTNERLEFLGDSVLGLVVTDTLFRGHPDLPEGQLAKLRAAVVNMRALAGVARSLGVGGHIRLGRGEEGTGGRDKSSILADTLEALIGAVYLDLGLAEASALVHRLFDGLIDRSASLGAGLDWKTSLQELTAVEELGVPEYHVAESGPDHQKTFRASVRVGGVVYGSGEGRSKKEAEQHAAEAAWTAIRDLVARRAAEAAAREAAANSNGAGGSEGSRSTGTADGPRSAGTADGSRSADGSDGSGPAGGSTGSGSDGSGPTGGSAAPGSAAPGSEESGSEGPESQGTGSEGAGPQARDTGPAGPDGSGA